MTKFPRKKMASIKKDRPERNNLHIFRVTADDGEYKQSYIPPIPPQPDDFFFNNDEQIVKIPKDLLTLDIETLSNSSKKNKSKKNEAPRPQNPFIIYKRDMEAKLRQLDEYKQLPGTGLSKLIGQMWNNETDKVKKVYQDLSNIAKTNHKISHKGYTFKPTRCKPEEKPKKENETPVVVDSFNNNIFLAYYTY
jgi:hypothetical protein